MPSGVALPPLYGHIKLKYVDYLELPTWMVEVRACGKIPKYMF